MRVVPSLVAACLGAALPVYAGAQQAGAWISSCRKNPITSQITCFASSTTMMPENPDEVLLHVSVLLSADGKRNLAVSGPSGAAGRIAIRVDRNEVHVQDHCLMGVCFFDEKVIDQMNRGKTIVVRLGRPVGEDTEVTVPLNGFGTAYAEARRDIEPQLHVP